MYDELELDTLGDKIYLNERDRKDQRYQKTALFLIMSDTDSTFNFLISMNNDKLYLISEEDYIKHINEKVYLYSLVKQLSHHIGKLTPNRGTKTLSDMAKHYGASAEKLFRSWGIPMYHIQDAHEAIVPLAQFNAVQEEIKRRAETYYYPTKNRGQYPFSGLIVCAGCGKHYRRKKYRRWPGVDLSYFQCQGESLLPIAATEFPLLHLRPLNDLLSTAQAHFWRYFQKGMG